MHRAMLSNWIRNFERGGSRLVVRPDDIKRITALSPPTVKERIESYLIAASKEAYDLDVPYEHLSRSLVSAAFCTSADQLARIIDWLVPQALPRGEIGAHGTPYR